MVDNLLKKKKKPFEEEQLQSSMNNPTEGAKPMDTPKNEEMNKEAKPIKKGLQILTDQNNEISGFEKNGKTVFRPMGISDEEWRSLLDREVNKQQMRQEIPTGVQTAEQAAILKNAPQPVLENNPLPERVNLTPPGEAEAFGSLAGPSVAAVARASVIQTAAERANVLIDKPDDFGAAVNEEILRQRTLSEVDRLAYSQAINAADKFGVMVEAIPFAGPTAGKYVVNLRAPTGRVNLIISEIKQQKELISQVGGWVSGGVIDPTKAEDILRQDENNINLLESKLKVLIDMSAELRANPEQVHKIESEVFSIRLSLFEARAKINAAKAGQALTPTDSQIYQTVEELMGNEKV